MALTALVLMLVAAVLSAPTLIAPHRVARGAARLIALGSVALLGAAGICAVVAAQRGEGIHAWWAQPVAILTAISAGSSITMAILSLTRLRPAEPRDGDSASEATPDAGGSTQDRADPGASLLRGGSLIGVFERAGVTATLLAGWPEGLAVVLALKGLGRFPELKSSQGQGAAERFILGTSVSVLIAAACAGLAVLLGLRA